MYYTGSRYGYYYPPAQFIPKPEQYDSHVRRWRWLAFERARASYESREWMK